MSAVPRGEKTATTTATTNYEGLLRLSHENLDQSPYLSLEGAEDRRFNAHFCEITNPLTAILTQWAKELKLARGWYDTHDKRFAKGSTNQFALDFRGICTTIRYMIKAVETIHESWSSRSAMIILTEDERKNLLKALRYGKGMGPYTTKSASIFDINLQRMAEMYDTNPFTLKSHMWPRHFMRGCHKDFLGRNRSRLESLIETIMRFGRDLNAILTEDKQDGKAMAQVGDPEPQNAGPATSTPPTGAEDQIAGPSTATEFSPRGRSQHI